MKKAELNKKKSVISSMAKFKPKPIGEQLNRFDKRILSRATLKNLSRQ